ncbi:ABC transporter permease [Streptomyces sp. NBC_00257]|uniref:ABC transporter permease subunit n=1 Tax=Streptomyces TaxID=1883 RepID=UPI00225BE8A3|nr:MULTISPECIES: ABC transporter permease [unclassified Streptomyces]WSW09288.1 ABC transporter permease [Streptomyces sp. NBC_01005]WTB52752.1 ABC transporter permease [Streptomyces sp. NBC_00826]WTC98795.1 ABC transporter permease [Streptomyces sp. NBC_01650]WTH94356.1 ABC transporter permease [Streptomyces sp. NBC_00825]WTI03091.1 ABC transporter permease [Streptomyces sp. NBC_00822]
MPTTAVLHSEWIKIRSVRSVLGSLIAVLLVTLAITVLAFSTVGQAEADNVDAEPVFDAFYALNFGQIAAISFGATALSSEFLNGALRISLAAVPRRNLFYAAKITLVGALALTVGLVASFGAFLVGQLFMGKYAIGLGEPGALRAAFGGGIYLALMALFAAGLTVVLRSAVAVLSLLIPFVLIVSFVVGDVAGGAAQYLPDRAGQLVLHQNPEGSLGPWGGLAVTAAWAAAALLAGWWAIRRRDA